MAKANKCRIKIIRIILNICCIPSKIKYYLTGQRMSLFKNVVFATFKMQNIIAVCSLYSKNVAKVIEWLVFQNTSNMLFSFYSFLYTVHRKVWRYEYLYHFDKTAKPTIEKIALILIFSLLSLSSCKLTENSVTGKWISNDADTLFIYQDHTFVFADKKNYYVTIDSVQVFDTSFVYSSGKWAVSKKTLYLDFDQDKKIVFGNCNELWNWTKFFSKYRLIRPSYCFEPSNRFVTFIKVRK